MPYRNRPGLRRDLFAGAAVVLLGATPALAQQTDAAATVGEVVVKGSSIRSDLSAFTTTTVSPNQLRTAQVAKVEQVLRNVPGVFVSDYGLGGVASPIVIRGFGAGGHGGDLGVVIDGIPLNEAVSHADGYVDLTVLVPLEIGQVTVFKGAVSALYGNFNRGGLIAFDTRKGGDYAQTDFRIGSFATVDAQAALGQPIGQNQHINLAAQAYRTDGYRPQSGGYRLTFAGRYSIDFNERLNLALSTRLHKADFDDPAYITFKQYQTDPYGIEPTAQNDAGKKNFGTFRADVNYKLTPDLKLLTFAYTTQQDFARSYSRPVNATLVYRQREETYQRQVYGTGASLNGQVMVGDRAINIVTGVEAYRESTAYQFYDALIQRRHTGPAIDDRQSTLNTVSAFGEAQIPLHRLLNLSLGARVDSFTGDCRLKGPETTTDPCGPLQKLSPVSPKIGLRSQLTPWLQLRASYAEGFALPSAFIKYAAGAAGLDATRLAQNEIGAKVSVAARFDFDIAAYRLSSDGEIATISPGVYQNLGSTVRRGIEASINWRPIDTLTIGAVYGYAESEVTTNPNRALLGKRVTGVPDVTATLNVTYSPIKPLTLTLTDRYVGIYFADAANTLKAPSFTVLDLGATYALPTHIPARLTLSVDNVGDKVYATAVFLSQGAKLLAPAPPRTVRAGVQLDF